MTIWTMGNGLRGFEEQKMNPIRQELLNSLLVLPASLLSAAGQHQCALSGLQVHGFQLDMSPA